MNTTTVAPFITATAHKVKETKNMVRYEIFPGNEEANHKATFPNVYVQKSQLANAFGGFPETLKFIIEKG